MVIVLLVDDLLKDSNINVDESTLSQLKDCATDLDDLLDKTSQALARLTDCMTMLVPATLFYRWISG